VRVNVAIVEFAIQSQKHLIYKEKKKSTYIERETRTHHTIIDKRRDDLSLGPSLLLIVLISQLVERAIVVVVKIVCLVIQEVAVKVKNKVTNTIRDLSRVAGLAGGNYRNQVSE
jgi:hypothetical protein